MGSGGTKVVVRHRLAGMTPVKCPPGGGMEIQAGKASIRSSLRLCSDEGYLARCNGRTRYTYRIDR